jgi:hemerythrin superfamily protein
MPNSTQLLRQDYKTVEALFKKFTQAKSTGAKRRIAEQAMAELEVHAKIEEEIFYPAVKKETRDQKMVNEAKAEHQTVKNLIREIKKMNGEDEDFEAKFSELMENVKHHVDEEQGVMRPKAEESDIDLAALGEQLVERKEELTEHVRPKESASRSKGRSRSRRKSKSARRSSSSKRAR